VNRANYREIKYFYSITYTMSTSGSQL